jgi:AcrR family transcriptional regulator
LRSPTHATRARSSRRDDQASETKRRLVTAAVELVTEIGWRRTTVEQIADRAGFAKGTFFVHFKTKESLVVALVDLQLHAARAARDLVLERGGSAVERLEAATLALGSQAAANVELSRAVLIASLESRELGGGGAMGTQLHRCMVDDAGEALATTALEGPDAETITSRLMACYLGATLHCLAMPTARTLLEVLGPLVAATLAALAPAGASPRRPRTKRATPAPRRRRATM